jgi:UDP-N-acetylglucosamine 3-dehydrogenase
MGARHASAVTRTGHELVAVAGRRQEAAEALASRYGARGTIDYRSVLADRSLDAVIVATPTHLHREYAVAAAEAGKHVFCEKPIALTLADGEAIIGACRKAGVRLGVGHALRYFPMYAMATDLVVEGKLGRPGVVRAARYNRYPMGGGNWFADESKSGGVILDLNIHDFDWLRWTFGEVASVFTRIRSGPQYAYALTVLRFDNGTIAHVEGSWAHGGFRMAYEIAGSGGMVSFDSDKHLPLVVKSRREAEAGPGVIIPDSPLAEDPYVVQLKDWLDGRPMRLVPEDGLAALAIGLAALESARTGEPVRPAYRGGEAG